MEFLSTFRAGGLIADGTVQVFGVGFLGDVDASQAIRGLAEVPMGRFRQDSLQ